MGCSNGCCAVVSSRREFFQATSLLAGSVVFGSAGVSCCAAADLSPQTTRSVTIRGHHLFDMLDALGTGKSSHKTLSPVAQRVRAQPKVPIKVVVGVDDICGPCEWWDHPRSLCKRDLAKYPKDNENSFTSDKNAIRVLGLQPNDQMPADELYRLIQAKVDKRVFAEQVCVACRLVDKCKETYEPKIAAAVNALSAVR